MQVILKIFFICLITLCLSKASYSQASNCLYKNPLCFYNTDILNYLQILHKNQQYSKMTNFIYGPNIDGKIRSSIEKSLANASFGYTLKRAGVIEKNKTSWSLTYQRTIFGTNETFKIDCALINDTCRIYIDKTVWQTIFKK
jgi:glutaminase